MTYWYDFDGPEGYRTMVSTSFSPLTSSMDDSVAHACAVSSGRPRSTTSEESLTDPSSRTALRVTLRSSTRPLTPLGLARQSRAERRRAQRLCQSVRVSRLFYLARRDLTDDDDHTEMSCPAYTKDDGASWIKLPYGYGANPVVYNRPERK